MSPFPIPDRLKRCSRCLPERFGTLAGTHTAIRPRNAAESLHQQLAHGILNSPPVFSSLPNRWCTNAITGQQIAEDGIALMQALIRTSYQSATGESLEQLGSRKALELYRVRLFFVDGFFTYSWAFLLADGHFSVRFARGQRPPASFGRPARPDHGARTLRSSPPPPEHSRGVLVRCLGKGDASAMAVAATTRFSGRAFWVALGATSDRARMDRHCRRAGEAPNTVRRLRES